MRVLTRRPLFHAALGAPPDLVQDNLQPAMKSLVANAFFRLIIFEGWLQL
jgi:hypothetical protein